MSKNRGNYHDVFFRGVMFRKENAASILRVKVAEEFGPELSARFRWGELKRMPDTYANIDLSPRYGDILYSTQLDGHPAFVITMIEHQSSSDPLMAYRLLEYMVAIWRQYLNDHAGVTELPAILPLVVHNNPRGAAGRRRPSSPIYSTWIRTPPRRCPRICRGSASCSTISPPQISRCCAAGS